MDFGTIAALVAGALFLIVMVSLFVKEKRGQRTSLAGFPITKSKCHHFRGSKLLDGFHRKDEDYRSSLLGSCWVSSCDLLGLSLTRRPPREPSAHFG